MSDETVEHEILFLKQELSKKSSDLYRAAEIGKALFEENTSLKNKIEETVKDYFSKLEAYQQENYSLELQLERKTKTEEWYMDEMSQMKHDLSFHCQKAHEDLNAARQLEAAPLRAKIEDLQTDLELAVGKEAQLQKKIMQLEQLIQEQMNQTQNICQNLDGGELEQLQQENISLTSEIINLKSQLIEQELMYKQAQHEADLMRAAAAGRIREMEELKCQKTSYINALEKSRMEMTEVRAQMETLRLEAGDHKHKGNSLFSEVEDRRVMAEKKLISLKSQLDACQQKLDMEKQQHHKLKMQLVMVLQVGGGGADAETVEKLRIQLCEARAKIQELVERARQREKEEAGMTERLSALSDNVDDKNYAKFLVSIINSKESEIGKLKCELNGMQLQLLDQSNAELVQQQKMHELEATNKKLHGQLMRANLKNEELLLKYDPDQLKGEQRVLKGICEKIPTGQEDVHSRLVQPETTDTLNPSGPARSSVSMVSGIPGLDLSYKFLAADPEGILRETTFENYDVSSNQKSMKSRWVTMSESVKVHFDDAHKEIAPLTDGTLQDSDCKAKENGRPRGRIVRSVRKVQSQPTQECKTQ